MVSKDIFKKYESSSEKGLIWLKLSKKVFKIVKFSFIFHNFVHPQPKQYLTNTYNISKVYDYLNLQLSKLEMSACIFHIVIID